MHFTPTSSSWRNLIERFFRDRTGAAAPCSSSCFKVELICIIDAIDHGTLVFRNLQRQIILPSSRLFHWAKRFFEGLYLRKYR